MTTLIWTVKVDPGGTRRKGSGRPPGPTPGPTTLS